jgi:hypothetical protein
MAIEVRVTRSYPSVTDKYYRCERIKHEHLGRFVQSETNKTHFLYPKWTENSSYYYIIGDSHTTLIDHGYATIILKPYTIYNGIAEFNNTYGSGRMSLRPDVHQEIVNMAVEQALQVSGDPRWQTKISSEKLQTN